MSTLLKLYHSTLSVGAQTYTKYYGQKWEEEKAKYDSYVAAGDMEGAKAAQASMDNWHSKANDIRRQDVVGNVQGVTLNVPIYNQLNTFPNDIRNELCWATCQAMIISYFLGDTIDRTQSIASYTRSFVVSFWGDPISYNEACYWISSDKLYLGVDQTQVQSAGILSISEIQATIDSGNPFAALYGNYYTDGNGDMSWSGHWVLGIGYATAPGHESLVISNDPWGGVQRIQTYNDFKDYYAGDEIPWRPWVETAK